MWVKNLQENHPLQETYSQQRGQEHNTQQCLTRHSLDFLQFLHNSLSTNGQECKSGGNRRENNKHRWINSTQITATMQQMHISTSMMMQKRHPQDGRKVSPSSDTRPAQLEASGRRKLCNVKQVALLLQPWQVPSAAWELQEADVAPFRKDWWPWRDETAWVRSPVRPYRSAPRQTVGSDPEGSWSPDTINEIFLLKLLLI